MSYLSYSPIGHAANACSGKCCHLVPCAHMHTLPLIQRSDCTVCPCFNLQAAFDAAEVLGIPLVACIPLPLSLALERLGENDFNLATGAASYVQAFQRCKNAIWWRPHELGDRTDVCQNLIEGSRPSGLLQVGAKRPNTYQSMWQVIGRWFESGSTDWFLHLLPGMARR